MRTYKFLILFFILISLLPARGYSSASRKPLPPLLINIAPVQAGVTSSSINPGDNVELAVTATSARDVNDLEIDVQLLGGAKHVSGSVYWKGSVSRNEQKTITLTVKAPEKGIGSVRVRVSLPPSDGTRLSQETEFVLGPDLRAGPKKKPLLKKDGKGQELREYRQ